MGESPEKSHLLFSARSAPPNMLPVAVTQTPTLAHRSGLRIAPAGRHRRHWMKDMGPPPHDSLLPVTPPPPPTTISRVPSTAPCSKESGKKAK